MDLELSANYLFLDAENNIDCLDEHTLLFSLVMPRGFEKLIFKQKIKFQLIVKSKINTNIIGLKPINCN